jgi:3-phosphoshikimate 1-carboxyvinyltransferase
MKKISTVLPTCCIKGTISLAGDKSISHRLLLLSLIHRGKFLIENLSNCRDVETSRKIIQQLGCRVSKEPSGLLKAEGIARKVSAETHLLNCENSGTTARLLCGILAGIPGQFVLQGDSSLSGRPMNRLVLPLSLMGAEISSTNGKLPIKIKGQSALKTISAVENKGSAQVKSALLFASTAARGKSTIFQPRPSRDHSERILQHLGARINCNKTLNILEGPFNSSSDFYFKVPGDISSAAFLIVAAILLPGSKITIENVLTNPGRIEFIEVLKKMGANICIKNIQEDFEPSATVTAVYSPQLHATSLKANQIPFLIDELPILSIAMAFAKGVSSVDGAEELRHKESDRIGAICQALSQAGIIIDEKEDGYQIKGCKSITGGQTLKSASDHRIAAALSILALKSKKGFNIENLDCISISFPDFFSILQDLTK